MSTEETSSQNMYETINEHLRDSFYNNPLISSMLEQKEKDVLGGLETSFVAAKNLLDAYWNEVRK